MKIAVVEDNQTDLSETLAALNRFLKENSVDFDISVFSSAEEFLQGEAIFDIALFDIALPEMSGMDLARKIRETDPEMAIIFLTNMAKYAIEGYSVNACGYVLKPINYFNFSLSMKRALASFESSARPQSFIVKAGKSSFPLNSLYFCEVKDHTIVFHLEKDQVSCRCSLSEIEKNGGSFFARSHASYLVNLSKITNTTPDKVVLLNGEEVPLSRKKRKEFLSALAIFLGRVK